MKKNLFVLKFIAAFTSIVLLFASVPGQVFAIDLVVGQEQENTVENDGEGEVFIVGEDQSKRGQFEKHYLCSDGTYMSVTYPEAVHYLDADGVWQDVDQTLCFDAQTGVYTGGTADFRVSFASGASATDMARMEHNGYTLTWGVQAEKGSRDAEVSVASAGMAQMLTPSASAHAQLAERAAITYASPSERLAERDDSYVLPHISAQIGYTDVFDGTENVSLRYTVYHNKIEEDIVIHERGDMESVSMHMNVGTLTPRVNADGSVDFMDADGEMQFRVGIPYMSDAANNVCNDIRVSAEKTGDTCLITYTPDAAWFTSSDRVYPVLLDPSVSTNDYVTNIEDTYVAEGSSANHSSEQYLSIANAAGSQKLIVLRINKLPAVDDALPIIDAKLTLTAQYAPFGEIPMSAYYVDGVEEFGDYDFNLADAIRTDYTFVTHGYLFVNTTRVSFSLTSNIYTMYEDERYDRSHDWDYWGDFVIGYTSSETTWACNPFYSMESTTVANRPVLTVKYGYALPAGILNGGVYSFRNCGSGSYMTVNGAEPANNSNVFQVSNDDHIAATTQKFKLEYVASSGSYRLRSMSSSSGNGKVLDIQRSGGEIYSGRNVQIYSATDPMSQEWLIIPFDDDAFRLVPRANMSLALTTNGSQDGSNAGKTASSPGNIFVQSVDRKNRYQLWRIFDSQDQGIKTGQGRSSIDSGNYYMLNSSTGRYLHRTRTGKVDCAQGMLSELGENKLQWRVINLGDGDCLIQRVDSPLYYLVPDASGEGVRFQRYDSEAIPPKQMRWSIIIYGLIASGYQIKSKANERYLTASEDGTSPVSLSESRQNFDLQIWKIVGVDAYRELQSVRFDDIALDVDEKKNASIKTFPSNADFAKKSDFTYTIVSGGDCVSCTQTNRFRGEKTGTARVKAVHKTTGKIGYFNVKVNKNAIIVIPGVFGSELYVGDNNPYFKSGTALIDQEMISTLKQLNSDVPLAKKIALIGAIVLNPLMYSTVQSFVNDYYDLLQCNDDGTSKYDVYTKKYVYVTPTYAAADTEHKNPIYTLPEGYDSKEYSPHAGNMDSYYDIMNYLHTDSDISKQYSIEYFSYDWRLSNAVSAQKLDAFIRENGYDRVVLIAHSMGGLVASGYMSMGQEQRNKVKDSYILASPLLGTPEVINVWAGLDFSSLTGTDAYAAVIDIGNILLSIMTLTYNPIQKLFSNYQSVYELFPTEKYIDVSSNPYLLHSVVTVIPVIGDQTDTICSDYATSMQYISGYLPHFNSTLMEAAEDFHRSCYINNKHISDFKGSKYIHMTGQEVTTRLKYYEVISSDSYSRGMEVDNTALVGDGLVPYWSATVGKTGSRVESFSGGHMNAVSYSKVFEYIKDKMGVK